jgi:hypothetical protein
LGPLLWLAQVTIAPSVILGTIPELSTTLPTKLLPPLFPARRTSNIPLIPALDKDLTAVMTRSLPLWAFISKVGQILSLPRPEHFFSAPVIGTTEPHTIFGRGVDEGLPTMTINTSLGSLVLLPALLAFRTIAEITLGFCPPLLPTLLASKSTDHLGWIYLTFLLTVRTGSFSIYFFAVRVTVTNFTGWTFQFDTTNKACRCQRKSVLRLSNMNLLQIPYTI